MVSRKAVSIVLAAFFIGDRAWDFGVVTTVPAIVLVVIALGIGGCRIVGVGGFFVSYSGVYLAITTMLTATTVNLRTEV